MSISNKRSRLSLDIPIAERLWLKMLATSQNKSINELVLSCIRQHLPCARSHVPNKMTAADLRESEKNKGVILFDSPEKMFKYLGLPATCLTQSSQKNSKKTSKKPSVKKKI